MADLSRTSTEVLEHECVTSAAEIAAATCRWLLVIAELDRREAWGQWSCRSMAHWLSWRCSLSLVTAREHVRVAVALARLPLTADAFGRGELSYSKVRALVRVATAESEAELVELARTATAAQLERIIGASVAAMTDPAKREELRELYTGSVRDGMGEVRARMRPEELSLFETAVQSAMAPKDDSAESPIASRRVDALVRICESYLAHGDAARSGADRVRLVIHADVDADTGEVVGGETDSGAPLHPETLARLACDSTRFTILHGKLQPVGSGRSSRTPSRAMRRAIRRRSGGRCEWIGCSERVHLEHHHVQRWTDDGPTEWWNLVALCWHHHHLVHEGRWRVMVDRSTDPVRIRCFRPDGTELLQPAPVPTHPLERSIDDERIVPLWDGTRMQLDGCVDAVLDWTRPADAGSVQ